MLKWTPYPFLRFTTVWILGILAGSTGYFQFYYIPILILFLFLIYIGSVIFIKRASYYKWSSGLGSIMLVLMFLTSAFHSSRFDQSSNPKNIVQYDSIEAYNGIVSVDIQEKKKLNKTELKVNKIKSGGKWQKVSGTVLLYFPKTKFIKYGDELLVMGNPETIPSPKNPYEFDYQKYLRFQNIFHQHFIQEDNQLLILSRDNGSSIYASILRIRNQASRLIKTYVSGKDEQAVALALILGVKDELDNDLKSAYGVAGAMHVLAVSGLHVGIVYLFLLTLFGRLRKTKQGKIVFFVVNLLALWFYAILTGFAAPVIRASIMFSAIIISQTFNRQTSIYNSIFFAAFFILLFNPFMLYSLGFQYSFTAVLGIVYLTPKIYRWLDIDNWLLDKAWMLTCVSLSAQIATLPITIFTFNFFPTYFWLVNLAVIPAAFAILFSGIVFLLIGSWEWMGLLLGEIVQLIIWGMNQIVFLVEKLPGSTIFPLKIGSTQAFLLYFFIIAVLAFFYYKNIKHLYASFLFLFIIILTDIQDSLANSSQKKMVIYAISGHSAIDFVNGNRSYLYANDDLLNDTSTLTYSILPFHVQHHLSCVQLQDNSLVSKKEHRFFDILVHNGKSIIVIKDRIDNLLLENKIKTDYLVIENNSIQEVKQLLNNFYPQQIFIGGSNSRWLSKKLQLECKELGLNCVSVVESGSQIIEL